MNKPGANADADADAVGSVPQPGLAPPHGFVKLSKPGSVVSHITDAEKSLPPHHAESRCISTLGDTASCDTRARVPLFSLEANASFTSDAIA